MTRQQVSLTLSPIVLSRAAAIAKDIGSNRSAVVNALLAEALADERIVQAVKRRLADQ